jgi:hypothetical protein
MHGPSAEPLAIGSPPGAFRIALGALTESGATTVLDCPAGEGAFAKMLLAAGYDVACCDIYPEQFKLTQISTTPCRSRTEPLTA